MDLTGDFSTIRTFEPHRGPWGRWEVRDAAGMLVGVVAEQPAVSGQGRPSTFTVAHNPTPTPFVMRFPHEIRSRGAWWSTEHPTVASAVAALARHLGRAGGRPRRHYMTRAQATT